MCGKIQSFSHQALDREQCVINQARSWAHEVEKDNNKQESWLSEFTDQWRERAWKQPVQLQRDTPAVKLCPTRRQSKEKVQLWESQDRSYRRDGAIVSLKEKKVMGILDSCKETYKRHAIEKLKNVLYARCSCREACGRSLKLERKAMKVRSF